MTGDTILETRGLTKEFKGFVAVDNVNLKVRRGAIHALIGPNGAGKTTVFNLLTKFLPPTRGSILFNGQDITHDKPADVARRGIVRSFQISAVFPNLTVLENVREHGGDLEGAHDAAACRLGRLLVRDVHALEADGAARGRQELGQQVEEGRLAGTIGADQRVDLAAAYTQVDVIDCDEPAEFLDQLSCLEDVVVVGHGALW